MPVDCRAFFRTTDVIVDCDALSIAKIRLDSRPGKQSVDEDDPFPTTIRSYVTSSDCEVVFFYLS